MTTIAYRDGVLAADTLITEHYARIGHATKIAKTPDGRLIGVSGSACFSHQMLEWAKTGEGDPPETPEDSGAISISPDGVITCLDHGGPMILRADFYAFGSGARFATAAMAMGADAEKAVAVAMDYDIFTGGCIEAIRQ